MTFSTSTIASSTSAPTAIAMPPRVMLLIDRPAKRRPTMAARSDNGIANSVMVPARRFARNTSVTMMTRMVPSRSAVVRLPSANSMKSAWRKSPASSRIPGGKACLNLVEDPVPARVSVPAC